MDARSLTPDFPSRLRRSHAVDPHSLLAIGVALGVSLAAGFLFLHMVHESRWSWLAPAVCLGAIFLGRILGERVWPAWGGWAAGRILALYARWGRHRGARLVIAPHADFVPGRLRQTWETVSFGSALALLVGATLLHFLDTESSALPWLSMGGLVLCGALTFLVVPHWAFARLGLRVWQPNRFIVHSVAEGYASLMRVGNGTLLVAAVFYGINVLAYKAPRVEGYFTVALTIVGVLALSMAAFGTAAATFRRHEEAVVKTVAAEARRQGFTVLRSEFASGL